MDGVELILKGIVELQGRFDEEVNGEGQLNGCQSLYNLMEDCFSGGRENGEGMCYPYYHSERNPGEISDDHGWADGCGGREDWNECIQHIRGNDNA